MSILYKIFFILLFLIIENIFKLSQTDHIIKARKFVIENEQAFNNDYPFLLNCCLLINIDTMV